MRPWLTVILALSAGLGGAALWKLVGLPTQTAGEYILENPEVLPEAAALLESRERTRQINQIRKELQTPFPGAVLGNPSGAVTLVEFSDYACSYCRASVLDVEALISRNPDLRVVIREYPILSPASVEAARMALAAARQGKYANFYKAMYRLSPPSEETIRAAAAEAGLDFVRAKADIASGAFDQHLQSNTEMAQVLGLQGTPTWVAGNRTLSGAVGSTALDDAIEEARRS